jgi:hypothetical protein
MTLLSLTLWVTELRENDIVPTHKTGVRCEHHIRLPRGVLNVLKPRSKSDEVVMEVVPLVGGERFIGND